MADTHDPIVDLPEGEDHDHDIPPRQAGDEIDLEPPRDAPVFTADPDADDYLDDDEFVRIPRTGSPLVRGLLTLAVLVLVVGGALFAGWSWFRTQIDGQG